MSAPTLAEQIDAVEWALLRAVGLATLDGVSPETARELERRLEAALETLRMLEFGRECLG